MPSGIPPELLEMAERNRVGDRFEVAARALVTRGVTPQVVEGFVGNTENEQMLLGICNPKVRVTVAVGRLGAIVTREVNLAGEKAVGHSWNRLGLHAVYAMPLEAVAAEISSAMMMAPGREAEPAGAAAVTVRMDRSEVLSGLTNGAVTGSTLPAVRAAADSAAASTGLREFPEVPSHPPAGGDPDAVEPIVRQALERAGGDPALASSLAAALAGQTRSGVVRILGIDGAQSRSKTFSWLDAAEAGTWQMEGDANLNAARAEGSEGVTVALTLVSPASLLSEVDAA
ncbi:MAG: hypothetical protein ACYDGN_04675 [Acidimicrobiales bacterium]